MISVCFLEELIFPKIAFDIYWPWEKLQQYATTTDYGPDLYMLHQAVVLHALYSFEISENNLINRYFKKK